MDWQQIQEAASLVLRDGKLPVRSKEAIKRALATRSDPHSVLEALCVLDSLALNCGRTFRSALAAPKWMKRLTQCFAAVPQTSPAVAQLLANWELTFRGEELGASAHATRKQLQASSDAVPQPNHFAHDMREYFEQHIPFIGFQHGFDFLSAFSDVKGSSPSPTGSQNRASRSGTGPEPDRPISEFQVGYLQDMSADVHTLGRCAAMLEQYRHGPRPSHCENAVRDGNALASKCCNWRACIQEWAADELLSYSLADMLAMNDRLHAELDRWESVTQSLILTQSAPMAVGVDMSFEGALQDHSQWFSPLGSSASRFTQDPPALMASALPVIFPGVPISGSDALRRDIRSTGQEEQALSSSAQQGARHAGAASAPPSQMHQYSSSNSHTQASAEASLASGVESSRQMRTGGASLGSWVAFEDSAQSAMPLSTHSQTACNPPSEHLPPSAQITRTAAPTAVTAGVPAALLGTACDQSPKLIPAFRTAATGSSSAQAIDSSASIQLQAQAMPLPQTQRGGGASNCSMRPSQAADFDLLHWDGAHNLGQPASSAAQDQGTSGSFMSSAAAAASMQLAAKASSRAVPGMLQASPSRDNGSASPSLSAAQLPADDLPGAQQASTQLSVEAGRAHNDLQNLKQELAAERAARMAAEKQLESSHARESGLQRQLAAMQDKLRDREFQLWNAKLAAKQGGGDDKGLAKQGTTHAIMAWCHQPALRVRFSAGQLEALAGSRELR